MGRQAYLTRVALGRSPFEEPELTESDDFVLGSHAHDLDNQVDGYVQQFDERGQPKHPAAKAAKKEFRHAKNEVMEAMGVVKRKGIQEIRQRQSADKEKLAALLRENSHGPWLKTLDSGLTLLSLWWLMSLRSRFQTFNSFSSLPLVEIIKSEMRLLGPLAFFSSGLLAWFVIMPVTFCRQSLVDITADKMLQKLLSGEDNIVSRQRYVTLMRFLCPILDFTLFAMAAPFLMFSDLQILHLIPQVSRPSLSSLIPFTRDSPIRFPQFSQPISMNEMLQAGFGVLRSPVVIFWLYDRARHGVEAVNSRIFSATVPRPNFPDKWSVSAANKGDDDEETIPGLWLEETPTLLQQIRHEAESLFGWLRRWRMREQERQERQALEEAVRLRSLAIEREILFGPTTARRPRPSENMAREIQRHAARLSWGLQRQTPPDDLDAWIGVSLTRQTRSTNTPEPEELFTTVEADDIGEATNGLLPRHELIAEATPLGPSEADGGLAGTPVLAENHNAEASIPEQTRNVESEPAFEEDDNDTFWRYFLHGFTATITTADGRLQMWENQDGDTTPPPVRRARMLTSEDSISQGRSRSRSRHRERFRGRGWARRFPQHRVTSLSNYPADAFAYHMSMVLTTVMMLPLESLYLRTLALGFLGSPAGRPGAITAAAAIRADTRSLGAWFGGGGTGLIGRLRYASVMALMWGMQAVISAGVWGLGTRVAIWIGRSTFGWEKDQDTEST